MGLNVSGSEVSSLRTFDVFDTVITRLVARPVSVFLLAGHALASKGKWTGTAVQFCGARVDAEARARTNNAGPEITFTMIYRELAFAYGLDEGEAKQLADEELRLELRLLRAVPSAMRLIDAERQGGATIAFVSDMYLPGAIIRSWLERLGVAIPSDLVWVSSDVGRTKSSGELFDLIRSERGALDLHWIHRGDNLWSDVSVPLTKGIEAHSMTECHATTAELAMDNYAAETAGLSALLAGAARWSRLSLIGGDVDRSTLNEIATQVAGPAVYAFVLWVVQSARDAGIRQIWFMARDGQVMIPIARIIAARLGIDLVCGYLYGGRQVVKLAALTVVDDTATKWISGGAGILNLDQVLARVCIDTAEVSDIATEFGLPRHGPIGWNRLDCLESFLRHPEVTNRILSAAASRRADVLQYFFECGLMGAERCYIVDLGWRGTVVRSICDLIGPEQSGQHRYLYFGLYSRQAQCSSIPMRGFLFDNDGESRRGLGADIDTLTAIMEIFCQADHGPVMRLERGPEGFVPICRTEEGETWDVKFFQQRMIEFATHVEIDLCEHPGVDLRSLVADVLRKFIQSPTPNQARVFEGVQHADDQAGNAAETLVRAYKFRDLRTAYHQKRIPVYGLNWWRHGAWALTNRPTRLAIRLAVALGSCR